MPHAGVHPGLQRAAPTRRGSNQDRDVRHAERVTPQIIQQAPAHGRAARQRKANGNRIFDCRPRLATGVPCLGLRCAYHGSPMTQAFTWADLQICSRQIDARPQDSEEQRGGFRFNERSPGGLRTSWLKPNRPCQSTIRIVAFWTGLRPSRLKPNWPCQKPMLSRVLVAKRWHPAHGRRRGAKERRKPRFSSFAPDWRHESHVWEKMVPGAGIEPARYFYRGILSPLRLPISPPGLRVGGEV